MSLRACFLFAAIWRSHCLVLVLIRVLVPVLVPALVPAPAPVIVPAPAPIPALALGPFAATAFTVWLGSLSVVHRLAREPRGATCCLHRLAREPRGAACCLQRLAREPRGAVSAPPVPNLFVFACSRRPPLYSNVCRAQTTYLGSSRENLGTVQCS